MYSLPIRSRKATKKVGFLDLPQSARDSIYTYVIQANPKSSLKTCSLPFVCRQIQAEFVAAYDCHVNFRLRCCLGRSLQDRETTKFYPWNYHTTAWVTSIDISSNIAEKLRTCVIRCTIEELGDWERRSEPGSDCFKDCLRILVRTFKTCPHLRDMRISFDHFALSGKKGTLGADEVWDRLNGLTNISGLREITFETPGFNENFIWRKEKSGKKGKGREEWFRITEEDEAGGDQRGDRAPTGTIIQCGARAPKGYGLRRGAT